MRSAVRRDATRALLRVAAKRGRGDYGCSMNSRSPLTDSTTNIEQLTGLYRRMLLIRRCEEQLAALTSAA